LNECLSKDKKKLSESVCFVERSLLLIRNPDEKKLMENTKPTKFGTKEKRMRSFLEQKGSYFKMSYRHYSSRFQLHSDVNVKECKIYKTEKYWGCHVAALYFINNES